MKVKAICIENYEPYQRSGSEIKRYYCPIKAYKSKGDMIYNLTIGKIYIINIPEWADGHKPLENKNRYEHMVGLKDDKGEEILIPKYFFKLIDKHRNDQIDQLLK